MTNQTADGTARQATEIETTAQAYEEAKAAAEAWQAKAQANGTLNYENRQASGMDAVQTAAYYAHQLARQAVGGRFNPRCARWAVTSERFHN